MSEEHKPTYIGSVREYLRELEWLKPALEDKLEADYRKAGKKRERSPMMFYRGEKCVEYALSPSIYRKDKKSGEDIYKENAEENVLKEFISHFHEETRGATAFEKLLMAQHYGLPTRLLDVTLNPLVALYFACEKKGDTDACVHIFAVLENMDIDGAASDKLRIIANLACLEGKDKQQIDENSKNDSSFALMKEEAKSVREGRGDSCEHGGGAYNHLIDALEKETGVYFCRIKRHHLRRAYFVRPVYSNPRIRAQEGGFIVSAFAKEYTKIQESTLDRAAKDCADGKRYAKLLIKAEHKAKILKQLDKLGVNEKTLFPEMEHVAKYINEKNKRKNADKAESASADLTDFIGRHFFYIYENGWRYEMYIKNSGLIDYRIHSGIVGGRWVRDQKASIVPLAESIFKVSWDEPTGTTVSLSVNLGARRLHCFACFPRWIKEEPQKTVCFQNEHLEELRRFRDEGETYPHFILDEWANIVFLEDCGANDETVINCAPDALPAGYAERRN